ncbi:hypothetical protein [Streptomyces triculaminicus]|uniref:hypothetical protein n=1 Tax=Streptomyces triculaminicus TaxID=2816232 RepID=UPI0037D39C75
MLDYLGALPGTVIAVAVVLGIPLLIIGVMAVGRAERPDIPAVIRALAGWFPWSGQPRRRR